ncbi:MAG TPA: P-II family nitrogen regulator [Dehalococcoidia bacterium]|nr:P-II family nitrogen regulator [Dehalococcoidia bacterium]
MKKIEAIIRPERLEAVRVALQELGCAGMTIIEVKGHGIQRGITEQWRGRQYRVDFLPKLLLMVVVEDGVVEKAIDVICETAATGNIGDGKIFVTPVEEVVRVRTRERGAAAM